MNNPSILRLSKIELEDVLLSLGFPKFHAQQIFKWIYKSGVISFDLMSDLPLGLRQELKNKFSLLSLEVANNAKSIDGTEKFLFKFSDANFIEAVIIPTEKRITACISTQAGCKFGCTFCASGISGFKRNLTYAEIIEEVLYLKNQYPGLTHIVYMGTGEPLDNYENVLKSIRIINSKEAFNIGARRITVSTSGVMPGIKKLAEEKLQIELSVSLHAAVDELRSQIMPINKKYPLKELINACKQYSEVSNRQVTFEYVLINGLNSDLQSAKNLATILKGFKLSKVNLIPANSIKELNIQPPNKLDSLFFKDFLLKHGLNVTLRKPRGQDIEAACGQLRLKTENSKLKTKNEL